MSAAMSAAPLSAAALEGLAWCDEEARDIVATAAATLAPGALLAAPTFTMSDAMNAVELMHPKLDPSVKRPHVAPIADRLRDGSLPLAHLTLRELVLTVERLMQLEVSHLYGNSIVQTVAHCLYTHPVAMQTMRAMLGKPAYVHATDAHVPELARLTSAAPSEVAADGTPLPPPPAADVAPVPLPALKKGSTEYALILALLAYVTASLKGADLAQRAVMHADFYEEEDWQWMLMGMDLCFTVSVEEVVCLLAEAEEAVAAAFMLPLEVPALATTNASAAATAGGADDKATSSGSGGKKKKGGKSGKADKKSVPGAGDGASSAAVWQAAFPDTPNHMRLPPTWCAPALTAVANTAAASAPTSPSFLANMLLARLRMRRAYIVGQAYMSREYRVRAPAPLSAGWLYNLPAAREAFTAAHACMSLSLPSNTPATGSSSDAVDAVADALRQLQLSDAPCFSADFESSMLASYAPRFVPLASYPASIAAFRQHLCSAILLTYIREIVSHNPHRKYVLPAVSAGAGASAASGGGAGAVAPILASHVATLHALPANAADVLALQTLPADGCATTPLPALSAAANGLMAGTTAADSAACGLQAIPFSGILDNPVMWGVHPDFGPRVALPPVMNEDGSVQPATYPQIVPNALDTTSELCVALRPHVSLYALLRFLDDFSKRGADVLVRSWLCVNVLSGMPDAALWPEVPQFGDFPMAHHSSAIILGSHYLLELVRGSQADVGVPLEVLASTEGRMFTYMMDKPFVMLLRHLVSNRVRIHRRLAPLLRDFNVICQEAEHVDSLYGYYIEMRCSEADTAALPASVTGVAVPPPRVPVAEHKQLHILRVAQPMMRLTTWAYDHALRLMNMYLQLGFECELYHSDELRAVYWYMEHHTEMHIRQVRLMGTAKAAVAAVRTLAQVTPETRAKLASGEHQQLMRAPAAALLTQTPADGSDAPAADAVDAPATDSASSKAAPVGKAGHKAGSRGGKSHKSAAAKKREADEEMRRALAAETNEWISAVLSIMGNRSGALAPYTQELDMLLAQQCHCRANIRILTGLHMLGLWRDLAKDGPSTFGLTPEQVRAELQKPDTRFFRVSSLAFANRFHVFSSFSLPRPLTYGDYLLAFNVAQPNRAVFSSIMGDAMEQLKLAQEYVKRAYTCALAVLSADDKGCHLNADFGKPKAAKEVAAMKERERLREEVMRLHGGLSATYTMPLQEATPSTSWDVLHAGVDSVLLMQLRKVSVANQVFLYRCAEERARLHTLQQLAEAAEARAARAADTSVGEEGARAAESPDLKPIAIVPLAPVSSRVTFHNAVSVTWKTMALPPPQDAPPAAVATAAASSVAHVLGSKSA